MSTPFWLLLVWAALWAGVGIGWLLWARRRRPPPGPAAFADQLRQERQRRTDRG